MFHGLVKDTALRGFYLTILANNRIILNKARRGKIRKKTPRKPRKFQLRNGGQRTNLHLSRVKLKSLQEKLQLEEKQQTRFGQCNHMNTRPFRE